MPNQTTTVPANSYPVFPVSGVDASGNAAAIHGTIGLSAADYLKAYVASAGGGTFCVVPRSQPAQNQSFEVSVIVDAIDAASSIALSPQELDVTFQGPGNPPQVAVASVIGAVTMVSPIGNPPADTGNPVISF